MYLRSPAGAEVGALIAIRGSREFAVEASLTHRLDLTFDDVETPIEGDIESMLRVGARQQWCDQNGTIETPPAEADAASIIAFARRIQKLPSTLLCHCSGGMSRAPAAALICLATWRGGGGEQACVKDVLDARPGAVPHAGLVQLADRLLDRDGRLIEALRRVN